MTTPRRVSRRLAGSVASLAAMLLAVLLTLATAQAQPTLGAARESAVKAAYLLNFTAFVDWPAQALGPPEALFVIAVIGDDAVAADLEALAAARNAFGRRIAVRRGRDLDAIADGAHVVYVASTRDARVRDMAARITGPVLIVTHGDGLLGAGAVLNFVLLDGRLRFEASVPNAEARGLFLSSRLLAVAYYVDPSRR